MDIDSYESLGGDDYPWLMAELYISDHTPEQDPSKPRRSTARHVNPSRPRIRAMRKRQPLLSADGGTPRASTHRATAHRVNAEGVAPPPDDDPPPF
ncbi:hypothetical protein [Arthrobacter sp. KK5.5]|uniref:hypothetical protein n=1 Tax=Arthrobacter sp. KK5.5 TaxID=3373084 RepID=UPI003EE77946